MLNSVPQRYGAASPLQRVEPRHGRQVRQCRATLVARSGPEATVSDCMATEMAEQRSSRVDMPPQGRHARTHQTRSEPDGTVGANCRCSSGTEVRIAEKKV